MSSVTSKPIECELLSKRPYFCATIDKDCRIFIDEQIKCPTCNLRNSVNNRRCDICEGVLLHCTEFESEDEKQDDFTDVPQKLYSLQQLIVKLVPVCFAALCSPFTTVLCLYFEFFILAFVFSKQTRRLGKFT